MRILLLGLIAATLSAQIAVRGDLVYTMAGAPISAPISDGVVLVRDGKIERVGPASQVSVPSSYRLIRAKVVTPGLIDAHSVVGLAGWLNQPHDQDQIERSAPIQPELRAVDAYDSRDRLVEFVRGMGITTLHTGHAPGALISGQTMIVKTGAGPVEKNLITAEAMVAVTIGPGGRGDAGKSPGTTPKMIAMLRSELIRAKEYAAKKDKPRDLKLDVLAKVLAGEVPLLVTVNRGHDILTALRVGREFGVRMVLDGTAEAYEVLAQIKNSGYAVIVHPSMARAFGETENLSLETASKLQQAGIPFALQSGYETYVPRTRIITFEAGLAAANGLSKEQALASITINAAKLLGVASRIGSLEPGKDADIATFDGDPLETVSHCTGVILDGQPVK